MNTHNIGFYEELTKIVFHFSPNIHALSVVLLTVNNT